jgi:hypothetical protein
MPEFERPREIEAGSFYPEAARRVVSMNDRPMALIGVGLGLAGFLYTFLNPAAIKAANDGRKLGLGTKAIWFWRLLGAVGSIASGLILLRLILRG